MTGDGSQEPSLGSGRTDCRSLLLALGSAVAVRICGCSGDSEPSDDTPSPGGAGSANGDTPASSPGGGGTLAGNAEASHGYWPHVLTALSALS